MSDLLDAASLLAILQLTRAVGRTEQLHEIYDAALNAIGDGLGVSRASILAFDPDGVMRVKAWRGLSDGCRAAVEGHTPWTRETRGARPIIVSDVAVDEGLTPYLAALRAEGIAAMALIPLEAGDGVLGKFMLYYDEPHMLSSAELQIATLIAAQVAFAIDRTKTHRAARESDERLRFALDAAQMGTWDWNLESNTVAWSDNVERIHGLPPGSFDGTLESYERTIHPDDRERVSASIKRALAEGVPHDVEYRIVGPDGMVRWIEGKGRVEYDADGRPRRMTGVCMNTTPRKAAEIARVQVLEDSARAAQHLAAIVESSDDAIVSKDLNGTIQSWNRGAARMFGFTEAEVIGRSITIIVPEDRLSEEEEILARVRAGVASEMETIRQHKSGRRIDISLKVSPVRDQSGRVVGASKIARDISARKQAEADRAELHRRLRMLVEASTSLLESPKTESVQFASVELAKRLLVADAYAVWVSDPQRPAWHIVESEGLSSAFANRAIDAYRGKPTPRGVLFREPRAIEDVGAEPMLEEQWAAYREEGIRSMLVCPMRLGTDRAGTLVFYYRTRHAFSDIDIQASQALANLAAAALTTADLYEQQTAQKNEAEYARRQAAFLADATTILSESLDYGQTLGAVARLAVPEIADWCAVDIIDPTGTLQRLAVAHVDQVKVALAQALHDRYPTDPDVPGGVHQVIRTGRPTMMGEIPPGLITAAARDDEHRQLLSQLNVTSYMCVPLTSTSGTLGAMTFAFGESGRRYTERDLAFAQDVAARAALAIENAFAYRRSNEANRLKDEFLATLSHELRTPLNAILGYAQMLNMGMLDGDRQTNAVSVLTRNAESLRQIIDDVLDVSRITSGKLRLSMRSVELPEILENAIATVRPAADAKGVAMELSVAPSIPPVWGDPDRLQQVVWNLLSNAVKFTPGGGHVQLRLERNASGVRIIVTDDGRGIEPTFLPHIFERFRQADSRFSREHGGLGLGLAIVRELIELHGGTVSASSAGLGRGATFEIRLPTVMSQGATVAGPRHGAASPAAEQPRLPERLQGVHVLAVDDEEDALGLLRVILESAGAEVTTAGSAEQAIELLERNRFDALIADIGMPRIDGLELIRRVRQALPEPVNRIPAAALTAYARSEDRTTALANGFQLHIAKPVNPAALVLAVSSLLQRS